MRKIILGMLAVFVMAASFAQDANQIRRERIQASYMLAFGRAPQESEIGYWQGRKDANSIADFLKNHKTYIGQDANTRTEAIRRAYIDAMGRNATADEIKYWSAYSQTYSELMKNHVNWLAGNPAEYEKVIRNSYKFSLNRQPSAAEINYWKTQGTVSYVMLVGCHEDWKKRNPPTTEKTSGTASLSPASSSLVVLVPVSSGVAAEIKQAAGLVAAGGGNLVAAGGGNLVAAGGGNLVAAGGGNLVAAGGGN